MHGALLIRTRLDGGVDLDVERRTARVPAGTRWGEVIDAAAPYGLAAPHGSSPLVGAVGYLLRGGVSFYGRHAGLAVNSVTAFELVTADGELRRVDASSDPELFWALRGGGGGFGVVTAAEFGLFPAARVITGAAYWPAAHADRLLPQWLRWSREAPREVTTTLRLMNLPEHPDVPPVLNAGTVLCVDGAVLSPTGDVTAAQAYAEDLLGPLRAVAEPLMDTWELAEPAAVAQTHMDPTEPFPVYGDHMLLEDFGEEGTAALLRVAGEGSGSPLTNVELRQLGGALGAPNPEGGVLDHLDAAYAYMGGGVPFDPVTPEAITTHCAAVRAALSPWDTGRTTPTFVEHHEQPQGHLTPDQVRALDRVRARVDPSGLFGGDVAPGASAGRESNGTE
jgi:FAD/FMN-containing dehydrogenase